MSTVTGTTAALMALEALGKKLDVTANNIANANSRDFKKSRADLIEGPAGGVEVSISKMEGPPPPEEPAAEGLPREESNVDVAEEMVHLITVQRSYEANMKSLRIQTELWGRLLDILG